MTSDFGEKEEQQFPGSSKADSNDEEEGADVSEISSESVR